MILALALGLAGPVLGGSPIPRALWAWNGPALLEPTRQTAFFAFLDAPRGDRTQAIRTVFLAAGPPADLDAPDASKALRAFLREAHRRRVRVDYTCGDAHWVLPEERPRALAYLAAVVRFNAKATPAERFDGFQFDVEPYLLKGWPAKELIDGYLALLDASVATIRASKRPLILGAAIPFWFDAPELNGLHRAAIDRLDYVALMDYTDDPDGFVERGKEEVAYATAQGKRAWLGAETQELKDEPRATFFAKGDSAMEAAFAAASTAYRTQRGFAGIAIHHYASYPGLRP